MITSIEEAKALCEKYGVDFSGSVVVTGSGNVYLTNNIDPADKAERFTPDMAPSTPVVPLAVASSNQDTGKNKKK